MIACPFIAAGHPFERAMDEIRRALENRPAWARPEERSGRMVRQHELKGVRDGQGAWRLDRFYSSTLSWDRSSSPFFDAVTYHYAGKPGSGQWFRFPEDPRLGALEHLAEARDPEVLQYVVLRRLTYRAKTAQGGAYIGKFKRWSQTPRSFKVLSLVSAAASLGRLSFRIPAPLRVDASRHLFHQEALPGQPVSELVNGATLDALLHAMGRIHAELHGLAVPGVPVAAAQASIDALSRDCDWIAFFRPADGARLASVRRVLLHVLPRLSPAAPVLCHGDFVCSHVLHGPEGSAVVDFDLAHRADPHADAAILLSSLTHDVPFLRRAIRDPGAAPEALIERGVSAYVEGYQSYGRRILDRRRLLWHRIAAEIHMLGLMFTKDRFHALAFDRRLALVESLTSELSRAGERAA